MNREYLTQKFDEIHNEQAIKQQNTIKTLRKETMKTQTQLFYESQDKIFRQNEAFLSLVESGLTKDELNKLIQKRPNTYSSFSSWLDKLPD